MKFKIYYAVCSLFIIAVSFSGCSHFTTGKISEGSIEYAITYPNSEGKNLMDGLMPSTMTFKFKDDKTCGELSASMGLFATSIISNSENKTVIQTLKLLGKKFAYVADTTEIKKIIKEEPPMTIEKLEGTKMIAGYKCKKAIAKFEDKNLPSFEIYYTDEIEIKNANWSNPFKSINGVLMEYNVKRYNIEMRFTAKSVSETKVEDETFELSDDYKKISRAEMDEMFENFN
jgi:GLPGLI family protein